MKKIYMLAVLFAAASMVACCGQQKQAEGECCEGECTEQCCEEKAECTEECCGECEAEAAPASEETTEAETTGPDTTAPVVDQKPVTTPVTDAPVTNSSGEELVGKGTQADPYLEIPTVGTTSMSVTTVAVPAGKSLFYSIQRIGGMYVTVNSPAAYVVCNGVRYNAQNGVVAFVAPNALASDFITLEIGTRFLTDYLEGDVYFKTHREGHNLDRARSQFQLVRSIESQHDEMMKLLNNVKKELKK